MGDVLMRWLFNHPLVGINDTYPSLPRDHGSLFPICNSERDAGHITVRFLGRALGQRASTSGGLRQPGHPDLFGAMAYSCGNMRCSWPTPGSPPGSWPGRLLPGGGWSPSCSPVAPPTLLAMVQFVRASFKADAPKMTRPGGQCFPGGALMNRPPSPCWADFHVRPDRASGPRGHRHGGDRVATYGVLTNFDQAFSIRLPKRPDHFQPQLCGHTAVPADGQFRRAVRASTDVYNGPMPISTPHGGLAVSTIFGCAFFGRCAALPPPRPPPSARWPCRKCSTGAIPGVFATAVSPPAAPWVPGSPVQHPDRLRHHGREFILTLFTASYIRRPWR